MQFRAGFTTIDIFFSIVFSFLLNNNSILYFQICQYLSTTETRKKRQSGISSKKKIPTTWDSKFFSKYLVYPLPGSQNILSKPHLFFESYLSKSHSSSWKTLSKQCSFSQNILLNQRSFPQIFLVNPTFQIIFVQTFLPKLIDGLRLKRDYT